MLNLILTLTLLNAKPAVKTAQIETCQWPHKCAVEQTAQVQTCQWPRKCAADAAAPAVLPELILPAGPIETCQWPHKCFDAAQVQTCVWPHVCRANS